jgi:RNA polymerase sigma-70 factor (ECF subfamily)
MKQYYSVALDRASLAHIYQQSAPKILDYIYKHVSSLPDAEDILIDVFVAALESAAFAALTEQEQQAWLWRVARNKVIDTYRRAERFPHSFLRSVDDQTIADLNADPEQLSLQLEQDGNLAQLIKRLSPLQQQVLYLRFGENLPCAQIAVRVGKREGSIRSMLSRAFDLLRRHYHEQEKGDHQHGVK